MVGSADDWVKRICRRANVPERCAHSMRGLRTTLDLLAGRQLREVADDRGHKDIKTTANSYAAAGAVEAAQQGRYLRLVGQEEQPGNSFPNFSRNDNGRQRRP